MTEQNHPWCRDVRRDEAIRAAEDAAAVPPIQHRDLPEIVADLRERVARLEAAMMPKSVSGSIAESLENKGGTMPAEGLRTKRVTLEVRWNPDREPWSRVAEWLQAALLSEWFGAPGESVRVVDEADAASDEAVAHGATLNALAEARESLDAANRGIARLTAERDAAIRERDAAKKECERLRAKIVAMEGQSRMETEAEIAVEEAWERCGIAPYWPDDEPGTSHRYAKSMEAEIVRLRACVAELEAAAAPAANASGEQQPPRGWLTEEEREAVQDAADRLHNYDSTGPRHNARVLRALLARSTPPKVRRPNPNVVITTVDARERIDRQWIAAIRAAGREVEG